MAITYDEFGNEIDDGTSNDSQSGGTGNDSQSGGSNNDSQSGGGNWGEGLSAEEIIRRAANGGSSSISDVISGYVDTLKNRWMTDGQWDFVKLAKDGMTVAGAVRAFQQAVNPKPIG